MTWDWNVISNISSVVTIVSAFITGVSALEIRSYYKKIVRQYSVEKLTISEQEIQKAVEQYQKIKRTLAGNQRGISVKNVSNLYLDIDEALGRVVFSLPTDFTNILEEISKAKSEISNATKVDIVLSKSDSHLMIDSLLNNIYYEIKQKKENMQKQNMK